MQKMRNTVTQLLMVQLAGLPRSAALIQSSRVRRWKEGWTASIYTVYRYKITKLIVAGQAAGDRMAPAWHPAAVSDAEAAPRPPSRRPAQSTSRPCGNRRG